MITTTECERLQERLELAKRQLDGLAFQQGQYFERENWHRKELTAIHQRQAQLSDSQRELRTEVEQIEARLGEI